MYNMNQQAHDLKIKSYRRRCVRIDVDMTFFKVVCCRESFIYMDILIYMQLRAVFTES